MNVGKALYNILSNDAEIVAICGTRVYPEIADQDAALPFIVYKVSDIQPSGTKSGSSSLDTARVDVYCVSEEYGEAMTISDEVRSALDRVGGTYTGVNIQSIDFDTADVEFDSDQRAYIAEATYNVRVMRVGQAPDINIQPLSILTVEEVDGDPSGTVNKLVVSNGSLSISGSTATVTTGGNVTSVNTQTGDVVLDADDISDAATTNKFATQAQLDKVDHLTVTQAVDLDTIESDTATNNAKVGYTDAAVDARIGAASITDLSDTPGTLGTNGQVLAVNSGGTALEFVDQSAVSVQYHGRYDTEAETERSGATATLEVYYTARPDGDGLAESEVSDVGETDTINRTLFYSTKFQADPDTAGDWTQYTTQPADNATFATAKAALLAGLNETDATAETRGTLPLSLKMVRTTTAVTPGQDLLLDLYPGAAAAYSTRKVDKDYTGYCMRVRRSSDDAQTDIGFDSNGNLDTAAIASHCGSSTGFVSIWYSQTGSNDATQSTTSLQPQIYNGTTVLTENGKPALNFDGSDDYMPTSLSLGTLSAFTAFFVSAPDSNSVSSNLYDGRQSNDNGLRCIMFSDGNLFFSADEDDLRSTAYTASQQLIYNNYASSNIYTAINGATADSTTAPASVGPTTNRNLILFRDDVGSSFYFNGTAQEVVLYQSDQSSNRTGIESNISSHYFGDDRMLETYGGAAAAYSVRQLSKYATKCMRIRRASDDAEIDIGFDSNGDLDTSAISTHGGASACFVTTWYDQSGNSNNATQSTSTDQPRIYNGSSIITENGKPVIAPTNAFQSLSASFTNASTQWMFCVFTGESNFSSGFQGTTASDYVLIGQSGVTTSHFNNVSSLSMYKNGSAWSATTRDDVYTDLLNTQSLITMDGNFSSFSTTLSIGYPSSVSVFMKRTQEVIIYQSDQSSNRTGIESDIMTYFSIT